jgi:TusA-related sulfurtransferase
VLKVLADDPMAVVDIPHMCHGEGHAVDSVASRDGYNEFALRKA